jgi:hypothetical protein
MPTPPAKLPWIAAALALALGLLAAFTVFMMIRSRHEMAHLKFQVADQAASLLPPDQLALYKQNQSAVRQMSAMQLNSIVQLAGGGQ